MTTAVYNRQTISNEGILSIPSLTGICTKSDVRQEGISSFMISLAGSIKENAEARRETNTHKMSAHAYYCNKYGDEFAYCDDLGFERSYMGSRADFNHIF